MARINVKYRSGSRSGTTEVFSTSHYQSLYLGRDPSCDIRFDLDNDDLVSRSHAMIEWDLEKQERFTITDLLSSNGTFVNANRINDATEIQTGDRINLGEQGPEVEIEIEGKTQAHEWIDNEHIVFDQSRATRVQAAIPDDPEQARRMLKDRKT